MTDKFANIPPRVRHCLVVAFSPSSADGERAKALREFDQYLKSIGTDGYEVVEKIETPPVSDEEMRRVFDTGREQGHAEAIEQQRNTVAATPKQPLFGANPGSVTRNSVHGFDDRDRISGHDVHNGYSWGSIAEHCANNLNRIADLNIPIFMFLEGNDVEAEMAFREIATGTKGAFCRFDQSSARQLAELLKAVAVFATGGVVALERQGSAAAKLLLGQVR